jgi:multidrug efflux system outer membrane protein
MRVHRSSIILAMVLLAGCGVMIPEYKRPAAPIPSEWPSGPAYKEAAASEGLQATAGTGWRDFYADGRLQKVIELALIHNRDLRIASLNIERARAAYRIQRAELLPAINAGGGLTKERVPADVSRTGETYTSRQYSGEVGITAWELDLFGRIRSLKESALEQYLATEQARRSAQIALIAAVANLYLTRTADGEGLRLARLTMQARESSYNLIRSRFEVGASSGLDVRQARTLLEAARVDVVGYTRLLALDENALNLLVGTMVPPALLSDELGSIVSPEDLSPDLSSNVLLARPDVLQAEHLLKAANADIGAARAAFFPRIKLTTSIGTISPDLSGLFEAGSSSWLFAPQLSMPIFDVRTLAAYDVTKIDRSVCVAQYEKTIQTAFREVADALAQRGTLGDQIAAQESLVEAASDAYRLSNARYKKGIDSHLAVLDAQRSLYAAQQALISLRLGRLSNLVALYKVLGGGV